MTATDDDVELQIIETINYVNEPSEEIECTLDEEIPEKSEFSDETLTRDT